MILHQYLYLYILPDALGKIWDMVNMINFWWRGKSSIIHYRLDFVTINLVVIFDYAIIILEED